MGAISKQKIMGVSIRNEIGGWAQCVWKDKDSGLMLQPWGAVQSNGLEEEDPPQESKEDVPVREEPEERGSYRSKQRKARV